MQRQPEELTQDDAHQPILEYHELKSQKLSLQFPFVESIQCDKTEVQLSAPKLFTQISPTNCSRSFSEKYKATSERTSSPVGNRDISQEKDQEHNNNSQSFVENLAFSDQAIMHDLEAVSEIQLSQEEFKVITHSADAVNQGISDDFKEGISSGANENKTEKYSQPLSPVFPTLSLSRGIDQEKNSEVLESYVEHATASQLSDKDTTPVTTSTRIPELPKKSNLFSEKIEELIKEDGITILPTSSEVNLMISHRKTIPSDEISESPPITNEQFKHSIESVQDNEMSESEKAAFSELSNVDINNSNFLVPEETSSTSLDVDDSEHFLAKAIFSKSKVCDEGKIDNVHNTTVFKLQEKGVGLSNKGENEQSLQSVVPIVNRREDHLDDLNNESEDFSFSSVRQAVMNRIEAVNLFGKASNFKSESQKQILSRIEKTVDECNTTALKKMNSIVKSASEASILDDSESVQLLNKAKFGLRKVKEVRNVRKETSIAENWFRKSSENFASSVAQLEDRLLSKKKSFEKNTSDFATSGIFSASLVASSLESPESGMVSGISSSSADLSIECSVKLLSKDDNKEEHSGGVSEPSVRFASEYSSFEEGDSLYYNVPLALRDTILHAEATGPDVIQRNLVEGNSLLLKLSGEQEITKDNFADDSNSTNQGVTRSTMARIDRSRSEIVGESSEENLILHKNKSDTENCLTLAAQETEGNFTSVLPDSNWLSEETFKSLVTMNKFPVNLSISENRNDEERNEFSKLLQNDETSESVISSVKEDNEERIEWFHKADESKPTEKVNNYNISLLETTEPIAPSSKFIEPADKKLEVIINLSSTTVPRFDLSSPKHEKELESFVASDNFAPELIPRYGLSFSEYHPVEENSTSNVEEASESFSATNQDKISKMKSNTEYTTGRSKTFNQNQSSQMDHLPKAEVQLSESEEASSSPTNQYSCEIEVTAQKYSKPEKEMNSATVHPALSRQDAISISETISSDSPLVEIQKDYQEDQVCQVKIDDEQGLKFRKSGSYKDNQTDENSISENIVETNIRLPKLSNLKSAQFSVIQEGTASAFYLPDPITKKVISKPYSVQRANLTETDDLNSINKNLNAPINETDTDTADTEVTFPLQAHGQHTKIDETSNLTGYNEKVIKKVQIPQSSDNSTENDSEIASQINILSELHSSEASLSFPEIVSNEVITEQEGSKHLENDQQSTGQEELGPLSERCISFQEDKITSKISSTISENLAVDETREMNKSVGDMNNKNNLEGISGQCESLSLFRMSQSLEYSMTIEKSTEHLTDDPVVEMTNSNLTKEISTVAVSAESFHPTKCASSFEGTKMKDNLDMSSSLSDMDDLETAISSEVSVDVSTHVNSPLHINTKEEPESVKCDDEIDPSRESRRISTVVEPETSRPEKTVDICFSTQDDVNIEADNCEEQFVISKLTDRQESRSFESKTTSKTINSTVNVRMSEEIRGEQFDELSDLTSSRNELAYSRSSSDTGTHEKSDVRTLGHEEETLHPVLQTSPVVQESPSITFSPDGNSLSGFSFAEESKANNFIEKSVESFYNNTLDLKLDKVLSPVENEIKNIHSQSKSGNEDQIKLLPLTKDKPKMLSSELEYETTTSVNEGGVLSQGSPAGDIQLKNADTSKSKDSSEESITFIFIDPDDDENVDSESLHPDERCMSDGDLSELSEWRRRKSFDSLQKIERIINEKKNPCGSEGNVSILARALTFEQLKEAASELENYDACGYSSENIASVELKTSVTEKSPSVLNKQKSDRSRYLNNSSNYFGDLKQGNSVSTSLYKFNKIIGSNSTSEFRKSSVENDIRSIVNQFAPSKSNTKLPFKNKPVTNPILQNNVKKTESMTADLELKLRDFVNKFNKPISHKLNNSASLKEVPVSEPSTPRKAFDKENISPGPLRKHKSEKYLNKNGNDSHIDTYDYKQVISEADKLLRELSKTSFLMENQDYSKHSLPILPEGKSVNSRFNQLSRMSRYEAFSKFSDKETQKTSLPVSEWNLSSIYSRTSSFSPEYSSSRNLNQFYTSSSKMVSRSTDALYSFPHCSTQMSELTNERANDIIAKFNRGQKLRPLPIKPDVENPYSTRKIAKNLSELLRLQQMQFSRSVSSPSSLVYPNSCSRIETTRNRSATLYRQNRLDDTYEEMKYLPRENISVSRSPAYGVRKNMTVMQKFSHQNHSLDSKKNILERQKTSIDNRSSFSLATGDEYSRISRSPYGQRSQTSPSPAYSGPRTTYWSQSPSPSRSVGDAHFSTNSRAPSISSRSSSQLAYRSHSYYSLPQTSSCHLVSSNYSRNQFVNPSVSSYSQQSMASLHSVSQRGGVAGVSSSSFSVRTHSTSSSRRDVDQQRLRRDHWINSSYNKSGVSETASLTDLRYGQSTSLYDWKKRRKKPNEYNFYGNKFLWNSSSFSSSFT